MMFASSVVYLSTWINICNLVSPAFGEGTKQVMKPHLVSLRREAIPVLQNGKVASYKTAYSGAVKVGHPVAQEFSVVFDTGSGHVVLPSSQCEESPCTEHRRYDMAASTTAKPVNADGSFVPEDELCDQVTIGYGTGSVTGEFVKESVCIGVGNTSSGSLRGSKDQAACSVMNVVVAVEMSVQPFNSFSFDGIFGLGLDSLALGPEFSFFSQLVAGQRSNPGAFTQQFGVFLAAETAEDSEIAIGGYNDVRLSSPLAWAPVALPKLGFWQVRIQAVRIGNVELEACKRGDCRAIMDTGTSHMGVPAKQFKRVADLLSLPAAAGDEVADCRLSEAPDVNIDMGHFTLTLRPEDYMEQRPRSSSEEVTSSGKNMSSQASGKLVERAVTEVCRPKIMPVNMKKPLGPNLFIFGEPILHRYYTVYDWKTRQVGFGLAKKSTDAKNFLNVQPANASSSHATPVFDDLDAEPAEGGFYLMQVSISVAYW
mmetsp:Transcript_48981/g.90748  ORF Transcript_48981/g.90748 Transcript_48981/m.90748 type:complete len:483 (-) Transcript_48981:34-1482(-)